MDFNMKTANIVASKLQKKAEKIKTMKLRVEKAAFMEHTKTCDNCRARLEQSLHKDNPTIGGPLKELMALLTAQGIIDPGEEIPATLH